MPKMPGVKNGAILQCNMGMAPAPLKVIPPIREANALDCTPVLNVGPFGMCLALTNPTVASATAAHQGVLTPMPCTPACASAWVPGDPENLIERLPAVTPDSHVVCAFGGIIKILAPG